MSKKQKNLITILALVAVSMMTASVLAQSQNNSTTAPEKSDLANLIDGTGQFIGESAETVGVAFGTAIEATGEAIGGVAVGTADVSADVIDGTGEFVGGSVETVGVAFGTVIGATGEAIGGAAVGIAELSADIINGTGELIGSTFEFIFGGGEN